jgi:serine/threonine-protein kinase PRP4
MLSNDRKKLKLIDFGNALKVKEVPRVPELLARYYKGPEVLLGYAWEYSIDMWAAACTIFELYTGSVLFPGRNDNEMVKLIMELKGGFSKHLLRKGSFVTDKFQPDQNLFLSTEFDPISKQMFVKEIPLGSFKPNGSVLGEKLGIYTNQQVTGKEAEKQKELFLFRDLLDRCLNLDPDRRLTAMQALSHPFFTKKAKKLPKPPGMGSSSSAINIMHN